MAKKPRKSKAGAAGENHGGAVSKTGNKPAANLGKFAETGGPGRPAGSRNKTGAQALQEVLDSLDRLDAATDKKGKPLYPGGYLVCMAKEQPRAYMALLGRALPRNLKVEASIETSWEDVVNGWNAGPGKRIPPPKPGA